MVGLLICSGSMAADNTGSALPFSVEKHMGPAAKDLPDLISMATEINNRSVVLEAEITELFELTAVQKSLDKMAKENNNLSRTLKVFKTASGYSYDQLFDIRAQIEQEIEELQEIIQSTNEAIDQAERWKREWADERIRWEQLESTLKAREVSPHLLKSTFAGVDHIVTKSQDAIDREIESLIAQKQVAEVIRASQSSLEFDLNSLLSVLRQDIMHKTARSMFSSKYYSRLENGLLKELPASLHNISKPELQVIKRWRELIVIQVLLSILLCAGILKHRRRLMEKAQLQFIARRPFEVGIFVAAIATSSFYGAVPGIWRLLALSIVIVSLARLVVAFYEKDHRRSLLVYGLSGYLIVTRLFGICNLPPAFFRLYIFTTTMAGIFICLWRSSASARRNDARLYTRALKLGALLCMPILIAEMFGYSALSAHLLESSLKTILIGLAGWMLMVMLRDFLDLVLDSVPLRKIPLLQVKRHAIIGWSAGLTNLYISALIGTLILVAWKVHNSPVEASQAIWSFGITVGSRRITVGLMLTAVSLLYSAFFLSWAVQAMLMDRMFNGRQLQAGVRISIARLIHYGFVSIGFMLALLALGVQFRDFTIIAGALGVGIGFGLQNIMNNFVSGLILLFERPIKVGDFIELEAQQVEIKKIGLRATVVQAFDRSEMVVPNSDLITNRVTNWTLSDELSGIKISVGVSLDSDVPRVMRTLLECAQAHTKLVSHPAPKVYFMGFGESTLDFELQGWIAEVENMIEIRSELYQEINRKFRSLEIQIPFPQRELHLNGV